MSPIPKGDPVERIVLVGFMSSGKSTVGRLLADLLGWRFLDLDDEVELRTGRSIPEIIRADGESAFRTIEVGVASDLLRRRRIVLATGGGWPAQPDSMESLGRGSVSVWLRVSAREAVDRALGEGIPRPLLGIPGATAEVAVNRAVDLLDAREKRYVLAALTVDTEGVPPEDIAATIASSVTIAAERKG